MAIRTDMALELKERAGECQGVESEELQFGRVKIHRVHITTEEGAEKIGKPQGNYVTVAFSGFTPEDTAGDLHSAIKSELRTMLPHRKLTLVAGLGNIHITPDALGPKVADGIFATRHISRELAESVGLGNLRAVEVVSPGVLGQTGIEAGEMITAAVRETGADAVIVIDALAARDVERLGCALQMSDSGICPGSGVGNSRQEISEKTVGVPVVAIGVPTVVDISTYFEESTGREFGGNGEMMVTPKDIDTVIAYAAKTIAHAINCTLQPDLNPEILLSLEY